MSSSSMMSSSSSSSMSSSSTMMGSSDMSKMMGGGGMGGMPSLLDKMGAGVDFEELSIAYNFFLLDQCNDSITSKMMGRNCWTSKSTLPQLPVMYEKIYTSIFYCIFYLICVLMITTKNIRGCFSSWKKTLFFIRVPPFGKENLYEFKGTYEKSGLFQLEKYP